MNKPLDKTKALQIVTEAANKGKKDDENKLLTAFETAASIVATVTEVVDKAPMVGKVAGMILQVIQIYELVKDNKEECYDLITRTASLYLDIEDIRSQISQNQLFDPASRTTKILENFERILQDVSSALDAQKPKPGIFNPAKRIFMRKEQTKALKKCNTLLNNYEQKYQSEVMWDIRLAMRQDQLSVEQAKITAWLEVPDYSESFVLASDKRAEGTGEWILENATYLSWKAQQSQAEILWIQGKVGSGKTVLSTTVINDLKTHTASDVCYHYFDARDNSGAKSSYRGLLLSMLHQMGADSAGITHSTLKDLYEKHKRSSTKPSTLELEHCLKTIIKEKSGPYIILDAMDECQEPCPVLKWLNSILLHSNVVITSRHPPEKLKAMHILLDDINRSHDLSTYLNGALQEMPFWFTDDLSTEIISVLKEKSDGSFRWIDCQLGVLRKCGSSNAVGRALKDLPRTLDEMYFRALEDSVKDQYNGENAYHILMWLVYAYTPLTVNHLAEILRIDIAAKKIGSKVSFQLNLIVDSTLAFVDSHDNVRLAHTSVKEFLEDSNKWVQARKLFAINAMLAQETIAHELIARMCIIYVLSLEKDDVNDTLWQSFPLAWYAAKYWPMHAHQARCELGGAILTDGSNAFWTWEQIYQQPPSNVHYKTFSINHFGLKAIHYAASFGLLHEFVSLASYLKENGIKYIQEYPELLIVGADYGHVEIVEYLLNEGADVNAQEDSAGNALQAASLRGKKDIVELLLAKGADINAQKGYYGTSLQAASFQGYKHIVEFLLEKGADINAQGGHFGNALQAACFQGYNEIVELLLSRGADINALGGYYGNALQAASYSGHKKIVELFIIKGADIDAQGGQYGSAMQAASSRNHNDIVELLARSANVNAQA